MPNQLKTPSRSIVIASGGTSGFCELEDFPMLGLEIPTIDSATVEVYVGNSTSTFRPVYDSTGTQVLKWTATTGNRSFATRDLADASGYHYIAVVLGAAQTAARTCTLSFRRPKVG